jgi:hypothetical protein
MTKKDIKISTEAREMAKNNIEKAQQTYATFSQAAERMVETAQAGLPETAKEFNGKLFSYANHNVSEMFDVAQKLIKADSMDEVIRIQNAYITSQAAQFQKQTAELAWSFQPKKKDK